MNGNTQEKMPAVGDNGQARDEAGANPLSLPIILTGTQFVNPLSIPTAAAGVVNWATCDALHTLARELVERGLVDDDDRLTAAMRASWAKMVQASYFPAGELEALEAAMGEIEA